MDGRNLIHEICIKWDPDNITIVSLVNKIPELITKIKTAKAFQLFGRFEVGAIYEMKNFDFLSVSNMINLTYKLSNYLIFNVNKDSFQSFLKIDSSNSKRILEKNKIQKAITNITTNISYMETTIILTDDSILIFQKLKYSNDLARLIFWFFLFAIIDMQINKIDKIISLRLFSDSKNKEKIITLKVDNILFFKEALMKRISRLKITSESQKLLKGENFDKKLTDRDINNMAIDELVANFKSFSDLLNIEKYTLYNITSFFNITKKIVEYYSARNDENHSFYLLEMKKIISREEIKKLLNRNFDG